MNPIAEKSIKLIENAEAILKKEKGVVGLDGFVDFIIRVVDKRQADGTPTYIPTITDWGKRIIAAAGKSNKFDLSIQREKFGGNGPIMGNALGNYGLPVTCVGNMGVPQVHPTFEVIRANCKLVSIGDACYTDAIEFEDGKIMLSKQEAANQVTWAALEKALGKEGVFKLFDEATFVALDNWTALPHMSDIWRKLQADVCPKLSKGAHRRRLFFDLADPEFRLPEQIAEAMDLISRFEQWFDTTLGLNRKEAGEIAEVLHLKVDGEEREFSRKSAEAIRSKLKISGVVVHATAYAAAADSTGSALVEGPFTKKPVISTGAGDHFNAGYSLGTILGGDLEQRLQIGGATSGFYVRTGRSPKLSDLHGFLVEIGRGEVNP